MNFTRKFLVAILVILSVCLSTLRAQTLTPRPPLYGIPAKTLPQGHWVFCGYAVFPHVTRMFNPRSATMTALPGGTSFTSDSYILKIRYGLLNRLTAIVNVPYVHKRFTTPKITKKSDGLGDVIGALLYKFYVNKAHRFLLSGLLFSKSPTGLADDGHLSRTEMPLGTGSFDAGLALMPEWEFAKWDMRWSAFFIERGKNKKGTNLGDAALFSWSTAYNFSRRFIAEGTFLYKTIARDRAIFPGLKPAQKFEEADELRVSLIVMGSHGEHGFIEKLFGSTTGRVLAHGHVPVLVVKPKNRQEPDKNS